MVWDGCGDCGVVGVMGVGMGVGHVKKMTQEIYIPPHDGLHIFLCLSQNYQS